MEAPEPVPGRVTEWVAMNGGSNGAVSLGGSTEMPPWGRNRVGFDSFHFYSKSFFHLSGRQHPDTGGPGAS